MKGRLNFLKLLNEFRALDYELKYVKEVLQDAHLEFEVYYRQWCEDNGINLEVLNKQNKARVDAVFKKSSTTEIERLIEQKTEKAQKDFKSLYKAIARKLHPDALRSDDPRKFEYSEALKEQPRPSPKADGDSCLMLLINMIYILANTMSR